MADALIALHYQNDTCHPNGRIPFALIHESEEARDFLAASRRALAEARQAGHLIAHVHIGFAEDYSDLPRNCMLFRKVEEFGALRRGSWGAAPFAGFEPEPGEFVAWHTGNSAFRRTGLEEQLNARRVDTVSVMGLATQFSVEHTVRDAVDIGYSATLLAACCASADREAHRASLRCLAMLADIRA